MNIFSVFCIHRQSQAVIKKTAGVFFVLIFLFSIFSGKAYATIYTNPATTTAGDTFTVYCDSINNFWRIYKDGTKYFQYSGNDCGIQGELDEAGNYVIVETTESGASPDSLLEIESSSSFVGEVQITVNPGPTSTPTDTPTNTPTPSPIPPSSTTTQVIYVSPTPNPTTHTLTPTPNPTRKLTNTPTPNQEVLGKSTGSSVLAPVVNTQDPIKSPQNSSPSFLIFANIILLFLLFNLIIYLLYTKYKKRNKVFQNKTAKAEEDLGQIKSTGKTVLEKTDYLIENPSIDEIKNAFESGSIVSLGIVSDLTETSKNSPDHWIVVKNFVNGRLSINDPLFQSKKDVFLNERYANWRILKAKIYN